MELTGLEMLKGQDTSKLTNNHVQKHQQKTSKRGIR